MQQCVCMFVCASVCVRICLSFAILFGFYLTLCLAFVLPFLSVTKLLVMFFFCPAFPFPLVFVLFYFIFETHTESHLNCTAAQSSGQTVCFLCWPLPCDKQWKGEREREAKGRLHPRPLCVWTCAQNVIFCLLSLSKLSMLPQRFVTCRSQQLSPAWGAWLWLVVQKIKKKCWQAWQQHVAAHFQ